MWAIPSEWPFKNKDGYFRFADVVVSCGGGITCDIGYEFCEYGCYEGICLGSSQDQGQEVGQTIQSLYTRFMNWFPTQELLLMGWSILILFVMLILSIIVENGWRIGIVGGLILFIVGIGIGAYPAWVGLILLTISGIVLASQFFRMGE